MESARGWGVLKITILETKYEAKFPRGRGGGSKTKNLPWIYGYFSGTAHYGKQLQLIAATGIASSGQVSRELRPRGSNCGTTEGNDKEQEHLP